MQESETVIETQKVVKTRGGSELVCRLGFVAKQSLKRSKLEFAEEMNSRLFGNWQESLIESPHP